MTDHIENALSRLSHANPHDGCVPCAARAELAEIRRERDAMRDEVNAWREDYQTRTGGAPLLPASAARAAMEKEAGK